MTVFTLFFGFLKMRDGMVNVTEESEILQAFNNQLIYILAIYSSLL